MFFGRKKSSSQLFDRYREVARLSDSHEVCIRMSEFLQSFRLHYSDSAAPPDLERAYGDCIEVLHELLDYVDRCNQPPGADDSASTRRVNTDVAPEDIGGGSVVRSLGDMSGAIPSDVPRLLDLIPEVLRAAELIMAEQRCAEAICDSPATIQRVLTMPEKLQVRARPTSTLEYPCLNTDACAFSSTGAES